MLSGVTIIPGLCRVSLSFLSEQGLEHICSLFNRQALLFMPLIGHFITFRRGSGVAIIILPASETWLVTY